MTPERRRRLLLLAAIVLAAIPWLSAFDAAFVYDDTNIVRRGRLEGRTLAETLGTRRPAVELTVDLNHALGGYDPRGYHLVNVLLHLVTVALVFGVVRRTLGRLRGPWPGRSGAVAFAAALVWGVHPLQTESVTYVVQRAEVMAGLGTFAALLALARSLDGAHARAWSIGAVGACAFAMASKASAATAPLILLAWDSAFGAGSVRAALRARRLLHLGCLATLLVPVAVGVVGGVLGIGDVRGTVGFTSSVPWYTYLASQPGVVLRYLGLVVVPWPLCIDRARPAVDGIGAALPAAVAVAALIAVTVRGARRGRAWAFAGSLFFLALAPTSSFIPIDDLFYEHRVYVALLGPVALAACAAARLGERTLLAGAVVAAAVLGGLTWQRNLDYRDPVRLFRQTLEIAPDNLRARLNLAVALRDAGDVDGALVELRRIVDSPGPFDIRRPHAAWHIAQIRRDRGERDAAIAAYRAAITALPDDVRIRLELAKTLNEAMRPAEAMEELDEVDERAPGHRGAALERVHSLVLAGETAAAASQVASVLERWPRWARAHELLGIVRRRQGRFADAIAAYREAVRLNPRRHSAWFNLSIAASSAGDDDTALAAATRAAAEAPSNPKYAYQVAAFHRRAGRLRDALRWLREAERLGAASLGLPVADDVRDVEGLIKDGGDGG